MALNIHIRTNEDTGEVEYVLRENLREIVVLCSEEEARELIDEAMENA